MPIHSAPLDLVFHALSNPTRRAIVSRLAGAEVPVNVLAEPFEMALTSFAEHLKVLENAGIIATEKRGNRRWCWLLKKQFDEAATWMNRERQKQS